MLDVPPRTVPLTLAVLFLFRLRFVDVPRRVAGVGGQGAGSRVFRFGREWLAAVAHANRFFFHFGSKAGGRPGACEQKCASEDSTHHGLPEPSHRTVLRYSARFIKKRLRASMPGQAAR